MQGWFASYRGVPGILRAFARRGAEETCDVIAHHGECLRRDERCDQLLETEIDEVLAPKQGRQGLRDMRLDLVLRVEQEKTGLDILQDRVGNAVVRTEQLLQLALVSLCRDEHIARSVPKQRPGDGEEGHSSGRFFTYAAPSQD